jgi:hypothetical protein
VRGREKRYHRVGMDSAAALLMLCGVAVFRYVLWPLWRKPRPPGGLVAFAASRDYEFHEESPTCAVLGIETHGVSLEARRILRPGLVAPTALWSVRATGNPLVEGRVTVRARADSPTASLDIGDAEFDAMFGVETTLQMQDVCKVLDPSAIGAVVAFGDKLNLTYEAGEVHIEWENDDSFSRQHLDHAIEIVLALVGARTSAYPYRDAGAVSEDRRSDGSVSGRFPCPGCGTSNEADASFCKKCGRARSRSLEES